VSTPVIIDTDPGIDDALALLLAARWPRCRLAAVTVVYGNTTLDYGFRNAQLIMERAGRLDVRVLPGAARPLNRELVTARETHGPEGLGDHRIGEPPRAASGSGALLDALRAVGEPVTLVTLGPLTNLAHALLLDPVLARSRIARHVAMGGTLEARGTMGPHSEFNFWCDPEAALAVLSAGLGTTLVGMDVTRQLAMSAGAVAKLAAHEDAEAAWLGRLLGFYVRFHEEYEGLKAAVINDPLALALALEPSWAVSEPLHLGVDLSETDQRGRIAPLGPEAGGCPASIVRRFDRGAVHSLLHEHLFGRWLTPADFAP
jgi:purine nucleosidase